MFPHQGFRSPGLPARVLFCKIRRRSHRRQGQLLRGDWNPSGLIFSEEVGVLFQLQ